MDKPVTAELIRRQAEELQRLRHAEGRDAELAAEVTAINNSAHDAAWELGDEDEPSHFARVLTAGMRQKPGAP
jgi:hypothetical protein